jgi:hypothetical protein
MEPGAHALGRSFPKFEPFRMGIGLIPPLENTGLYFRGEFHFFPRLDNFIFMPLAG